MWDQQRYISSNRQPFEYQELKYINIKLLEAQYGEKDKSRVEVFSLNFSFLQVGKLADLVLWNPAFFGAKPEMIIKGGDIAWANMGDANASIPTPEPVTTVFLCYLIYGIQFNFLFLID